MTVDSMDKMGDRRRVNLGDRRRANRPPDAAVDSVTVIMLDLENKAKAEMARRDARETELIRERDQAIQRTAELERIIYWLNEEVATLANAPSVRRRRTALAWALLASGMLTAVVTWLLWRAHGNP